jgi:hypothetical protein
VLIGAGEFHTVLQPDGLATALQGIDLPAELIDAALQHLEITAVTIQVGALTLGAWLEPVQAVELLDVPFHILPLTRERLDIEP